MAKEKSKDAGGQQPPASPPDAAMAPEMSDEELEKLTAPDADKAAAEAAEGKAPRAPYHVRGPGSVSHGGAVHAPGAQLELTAREAKSLGDAVAPGPPPKKRRALDSAGRYRITGPGNICQGGKFREPGDELDLSAAEAKAFADRIEPV